VCTGHEQDIYGLAASPDGGHFASASGDKTLRVWDMRGNELGQFMSGDGLTDVAFLTADHVVYSSLDMTIGIVKWQTGELVQVLSGHKDSVYGLDVLPNSRTILSASLDKNVISWSEALETGNHNREYHTLNRKFVGHKVRAKTYLIRRADASSHPSCLCRGLKIIPCLLAVAKTERFAFGTQ
jgi:WD40 repeat protein